MTPKCSPARALFIQVTTVFNPRNILEYTIRAVCVCMYVYIICVLFQWRSMCGRWLITIRGFPRLLSTDISRTLVFPPASYLLHP